MKEGKATPAGKKKKHPRRVSVAVPEPDPSLCSADILFARFDGLVSGFLSGDVCCWNEVDPAAHAFACALWLRHRKRRACFICRDVRSQELLSEELGDWVPGGGHLPFVPAPVGDEALPDPEVLAAQLELLARVSSGNPPEWLAVTSSQLQEEVARPDELRAGGVTLSPEASLSLEHVVALLDEWDYDREPKVFARGQYSVRGGILDVFCPQHRAPVRIEFFDAQIESLREFDPDSQISTGRIGQFELLPKKTSGARMPLLELLNDFELVWIDPEEGVECSNAIRSAMLPGDETSPVLHAFPEAVFRAGEFLINEIRRSQLFDTMRRWISEGWMLAFVADNEGEAERFHELCMENKIPPSALAGFQGAQRASFVCREARFALLTDTDVFGRENTRRIKSLASGRDRLQAVRALEDFSEFSEGDYVVDVDHGIGIFRGIQSLGPETGETLCIEYDGGAKNYVPLKEAWRLSRYAGLGRSRPPLSTLGSPAWDKSKEKARGAVFAYAKEMLRLQAERETSGGFAFPPDNAWQKEFEASFLFRETADQLRAIEAVKEDMESPRPMDRLICGDVGFGKTEVAIRAAFKAVMGGKQVAFLAPTTVLAQQHHDTLRERMSDYPVRIELLNRYRSKAEQQETLRAVSEGDADIVVGTHRLLSGDLRWKDLGLLIVDEEQRFGVRHKELLKERFRLVDVLTLSATPIPRTLYLSLTGARDMSVIETPPPNRQPVQTFLCGYDERVIRDAIRRELDRGGQVYFLHNRVATIQRLAGRVRELVPGANVEFGHGQMGQGELEDVMKSFVEGRTDVLISTTIIESGLDIPNANTILIDRADLFGLADLYQLRGRVGRSGVKAYAYLFLPRSLIAVGESKKRLSAIKQYAELGSGFKIAMRDLEIRGAGNILGTAQSGQIVNVGFDLYCKLLRSAVAKLKGQGGAPLRTPCQLRLDFVVSEENAPAADSQEAAPAFLPSQYLPDSGGRIEAYRKFHECVEVSDLENLRNEWRDRYGILPQAAENLLLTGEILIEAAARKISEVRTRERKLMLTRRGDYLLVGGKFPRITAGNPNSQLREVLDIVKSLLL